MTLNSQSIDRLYLCPQCNSAARGPSTGGSVVCPRCQAPYALPERRVPPEKAGTPPVPNNDPARIARLRAQPAGPRSLSPAMLSALGSNRIRRGGEQAAIALWQQLRARALGGDASASEDMSILTQLIGQLPSSRQQTEFRQALAESALDAAVLPRHRQEQFSRLCRYAASAGDRPRALAMLGMMDPAAPDLDADCEYRIASAVVAAMDRDGQRVLEALGPEEGAIPIANYLRGLASILRANGYDLLGDIPTALRMLKKLSDPHLLERVQANLGSIKLCAQSSATYLAELKRERVQSVLLWSLGGLGGLAAIIVSIYAMTWTSRADRTTMDYFAAVREGRIGDASRLVTPDLTPYLSVLGPDAPASMVASDRGQTILRLQKSHRAKSIGGYGGSFSELCGLVSMDDNKSRFISSDTSAWIVLRRVGGKWLVADLGSNATRPELCESSE